MSTAKMPHAILKPKEERRLLRGHLWAYRNEFAYLPEATDGALVDVFAEKRRFIGRGFFQAEGGIAIRLLSQHQETIDRAFFEERLKTALNLREQQFPHSTIYRWLYGESDLLPGLVVDRYDSVVVMQSACAFYEQHLELVSKTIKQLSNATNILWKCNDSQRWLDEPVHEIELQLDGIEATLPFSAFQKTGLFLDQRNNWKLMRKYAQQASVLDGYCHHGFWSMHAALAGARRVLGVDSSAAAIACAKHNADRNHLTACAFEDNDMEIVLSREQKYDVIVIDPPAFAKHRAQEKKALAQYEQINALAMKALERNGILITCSCSHFVSSDAFLDMLKRAASNTGKRMQILEQHGAGPDHPVLLSMPETDYLKCVALRML